MLPLLLALLRNDLAGGGGGGPFTITGVNLTVQQSGTSCANPLRLHASLVYTGSPSGKTCLVERQVGIDAFEAVAAGVSPTAFPVLIDGPGYFNKFGVTAQVTVRVTDETDPTNTRGKSHGTTYTLCDV